jgi:hypothetical protein
MFAGHVRYFYLTPACSPNILSQHIRNFQEVFRTKKMEVGLVLCYYVVLLNTALCTGDWLPYYKENLVTSAALKLLPLLNLEYKFSSSMW